MTIQQYVENINRRYVTGISREHSYRGDLQTLIEKLVPGVLVTNEPARVSCGAPDYIITKKDIPLGYIEAKDIGKDLKSKDFKEQFNRYRESLDNLAFTDYLDFHFYKDGEFATSVKIAEIKNSHIEPLPGNFEHFTNLVKDFCIQTGQTIKSASKLSKMMASKAKMLANVLEKALNSDEQNSENSSLRDQMNAFKKVLIHDITPRAFADIYAQTIAYGMFAARLHDQTLETFSRFEAAQLIPKSNPFLRKLFQDIAGFDLDTRIAWIVDALADIFRATDVAAILKNFGKATQTQDPIIHFYETFLAEYDPNLRKTRGVWYTPEPVVNFIVRAVDDILKTEFDLPKGLADTSKTEIEVDSQVIDSRSKTGYKRVKQEVHKVQILDPATGTGTFLAEIITHIYKKFKGQQGIWNGYVEDDLIPRLNGFELLMASYSMAHLKLDLLLKETGYKPTKEQRFRVYLTNSLEEHHPDTGSLFSSWLSNEASEANYVKRDTPVMVVLGNPPYNRSSSNSSEFILGLIKDYKDGLKERNLVPLDDDYIKFIRYGQYYIDKNGEGILAYISNNSFIDGITHRQMRKSLLESFDKIYILDLHGNTKKKEVSPDGSPDQNVFDIMTGVSINIFVKTNKKNKDCKVFHKDLFGKRDIKYKFLENNLLESIDWNILDLTDYSAPWINIDMSLGEYNKYISLTDLFNVSTPCIRTHNDKELVSFERFKTENNQTYLFKPFDHRFIDYDLKKIGRARYKVMKEVLNGENITIIFQRGCPSQEPHTPFITKYLSDQGAVRPGTTSTSTIAPLYLYQEINDQQSIIEKPKRSVNLNEKIVEKFSKILKLSFSDKKFGENDFTPLDILDYIYAVLHSPTYREKYKEFLKIDFPRVPYPKDKETFWQLVKLGGELRKIHLLESPVVEDYITSYPQAGNNTITRKITKKDFELNDGASTGKVWINDEQYFDNIPVTAWEFYIGGYQPAQKWLKDRREEKLSTDELLHYQKIIVALHETDRIMKEIDKIEIE